MMTGWDPQFVRLLNMQNMSWYRWFGVALSAITTAIPYFLPMIPAEYKPIATASLGLINGLIHTNLPKP